MTKSFRLSVLTRFGCRVREELDLGPILSAYTE